MDDSKDVPDFAEGIFTKQELDIIHRIELVEKAPGSILNYVILCTYLGIIVHQKKKILGDKIHFDDLDIHLREEDCQKINEQAIDLIRTIRLPGKFQWKKAIFAGFTAGWLRYASTGVILAIIYFIVYFSSNPNDLSIPSILRKIANSFEQSEQINKQKKSKTNITPLQRSKGNLIRPENFPE